VEIPDPSRRRPATNQLIVQWFKEKLLHSLARTAAAVKIFELSSSAAQENPVLLRPEIAIQ